MLLLATLDHCIGALRALDIVPITQLLADHTSRRLEPARHVLEQVSQKRKHI